MKRRDTRITTKGNRIIIRSAAVVLGLLIFGDALVDYLQLPLPGAALGLFALVAAFWVRGGPGEGSEELFDFAAPYFQLFFVPAAVGIIANLDMLAIAWFQIAAAIVPGTIVTLLVTGHIAQRLMAPTEERAPA